MLKTVPISDELAELLGPEERLPQAFTEAVVLELFREHRISVGKAAELLGLSYREFLELLQTKNIPVVTTPPRDPQEVADLLHRAKG
jgi:predicted HTH domain antitoxin